MKTCSRCGRTLPPEQFYVDRGTKNGLHRRCKECDAAYSREWAAGNRERAARTLRLWRAANKERLRAARARRWSSDPGLRPSERAARRQRTRSSRGAAGAAVRRYYRLARALREAGFRVHVGHWLPLKGVTVCGLHVEANLCLEFARDNERKGARVIPTWDPPVVSKARAYRFCGPGPGSA